jgi:hypothetical protein
MRRRRRRKEECREGRGRGMEGFFEKPKKSFTQNAGEGRKGG